MSRREQLEARYVELVGHPPVERYPEQHPERWQWDYRGTPEERQALERGLGLVDEGPAQLETLFGAEA